MTRDDLVVRVHQPFSIDSIEGKNAILTQQRGCHLLKTLNVAHWVSSGNLLGMYRDSRLIPHDTDIDINFKMEWGTDKSYKLTGEIIKLFFNNNLVLVYSTFCENNAMQLVFVDKDTDVICDLYGFYTGVEDGIAINYNIEGIIRKPLKFIELLGSVEFEGKTYPAPNHLDEFMVWRFGKDWRTPRKEKVSWTQEAAHLMPW